MTLSSLINAYKQRVKYFKSNTVTVVAGLPYTVIDRAGFPTAGSLNPGDATNGIVPTASATGVGYPPIVAFQGSNKGYISKVDMRANVAGTISVYDVLFRAGQTTIPTSGTTTVTLGSPPSFQARVPYKGDGSTRDYNLVELFIEASTALSNHAHTTSIDYLDEGGNAGNTGNVSTQNIPVNRWLRCPLAANDVGVSAIAGYKVNGATSATGSVSIVAARRLFTVRAYIPGSFVFGPDVTGMPQVFADSALLAVVLMDSTTSQLVDLDIEIAESA